MKPFPDPKTKKRRDRALLRLYFKMNGLAIDVSRLSDADVKEGVGLVCRKSLCEWSKRRAPAIIGWQAFLARLRQCDDTRRR
jgi:hypothetical protein